MSYFATNFQPTGNVTKNSILYVARVLDIPLVELSVCTFNVYFFCFSRKLLAQKEAATGNVLIYFKIVVLQFRQLSLLVKSLKICLGKSSYFSNAASLFYLGKSQSQQ